MRKSVFPLAAFLAFLLALLAGGCVNLDPLPDTSRSFVLGELPAEAAAGGAAGGPFFARPEIPPYLRGDAMVYRTASGEIRPVGGHRWAEPLDEGVARALAQAWPAHAGSAAAGFYPWAMPGPQAPAVRVRLHAFGGDERGRVVLDASWERTGGGPQETARGRFSSQVDGWQPGDPEGLVAALNTLLDRLAAELAAKATAR